MLIFCSRRLIYSLFSKS